MNQASVVAAPVMVKGRVARVSAAVPVWDAVDPVRVVALASLEVQGMAGGIQAAAMAMVLVDLAMVGVVALGRVRVTLDMGETLALAVVQVLDPVPWDRVMVQACPVMAVISAPVVDQAPVPVQKALLMDRVILVMVNLEARE